MIPGFCDALILKIREGQMSIAETLTSGRCKTYEDYRHFVGHLQGLKQSEQIIRDAYNAAIESRRIEDDRRIELY